MNIIVMLTLMIALILGYFNKHIYILIIPIMNFIWLKNPIYKKILYIMIIMFAMIVSNYIMSSSKNNYYILFFTISLLLTIIISHFIFRNKNKEINVLQNKLLESEGNIILRDILRLAIKDEEMTLLESTKKICNVIRNHYEVKYCTIFLNTPRGLSIAATNIEDKYRSHMEKYANNKLKEIFYQTNQGADASIICGDEILDYPTAIYRGICYFYFIPLNLGDKMLGALMIEDISRYRMESLENNFFEIVIENITIVLQNFIYKAKLVSVAMVDGLTQVWNRTYLDKYLNNEINGHDISDEPIAIAVMDVDYFKKFNDTYGHLHGDKVLRRISKFIKENIREGKDIVARYGGEEFVIVFTETSTLDIYEKVDWIREKLSQLIITNDKNENTPVTVSFGIAEYPNDADNVTSLIKRADEALYFSKENGRNKVTQYSGIA
ncbi:GGDEF domain-containing protein [Sporosalibacterium faouarense]|uniref:GGDEF domain-containing protein n=1 Tax=Sporosalibacterium faouarense TaxID=516123 RepID=UPI00192C9E9F|nr:GGDEF domain-containing protein [Sporosalibacterium faouarense]